MHLSFAQSIRREGLMSEKIVSIEAKQKKTFDEFISRMYDEGKLNEAQLALVAEFHPSFQPPGIRQKTSSDGTLPFGPRAITR